MRGYVKQLSLLVLVFLFLMQGITEAKVINGQKEEVKEKNSRVTEQKITDYWQRLKEKANKLYKGLDLSVEVLTGLYEDNEYKGEVKVKVPLYGKERRRKKEEERMNFLDKGAELIRSLEIKSEKLKILREKEIMLKTIMLEEGVRSIDAYHDVREDIAEVEAEIDEAVRKLETMID